MLGKKQDLIIDFLVKYRHFEGFSYILSEPAFRWSVSASDIRYRLLAPSDKKCRDIYDYGCTIRFRKERNSSEGYCVTTSPVIGNELEREIVDLRGGLHDLFI